MAKINCECSDCKNKFNVSYLFLKPDRFKCPVCGSSRVKEVAAQVNGCGCGSKQDKPFRFT